MLFIGSTFSVNSSFTGKLQKLLGVLTCNTFDTFCNEQLFYRGVVRNVWDISLAAYLLVNSSCKKHLGSLIGFNCQMQCSLLGEHNL